MLMNVANEVSICHKITFVVGRISTGKKSFCRRLIRAYPLKGAMCMEFNGNKPLKFLNDDIKEITKLVKSRHKNGLYTVIICQCCDDTSFKKLISAIGILSQLIVFDLKEDTIDGFMTNNHVKYKNGEVVQDRMRFQTIMEMEPPKLIDKECIIRITDPRKVRTFKYTLKL